MEVKTSIADLSENGGSWAEDERTRGRRTEQQRIRGERALLKEERERGRKEEKRCFLSSG